MIGQGLGRLAFAEKLSIPQLEEALENKTIPAYIGVPLLEEKVQMRERMMAAQANMTPPPQMTIEEEIMARANQADPGIDELPVELPDYAGGGIVALADGGDVIRAYNGLPEEMYQTRPPMKGIVPAVGETLSGIKSAVGDYFQGGIYNDIAQLMRLGYTDAQISQMSPAMRSAIAKQTRDQSTKPDVTPVSQTTAPQAAPPEAPPAGDQTNVVADPGIAPPETPAPRGASQLSVPDLIGRAEQLHGALYGDQKPEVPAERGDYLTRAQEFLTQSGVDLNLASKQAEEVARQKADLEGDRREAKKFSVISAGLAILAGDPANSVAENIGKGLGKGMEKYTAAIGDIKKTEREMQALERSLAVAQNQARMGVATMAAGDYRDAQKRYDDLNKEMRSSKADLVKALMSDDRARQVVEAQMQSKKSTFAEQVEALMSDDPRRVAAAKTAIGASKTGDLTRALLVKEWNDMKPQDKLAQKRKGITTEEEYIRSKMGDLATSGSPSGASNDPLGLRTPKDAS